MKEQKKQFNWNDTDDRDIVFKSCDAEKQNKLKAKCDMCHKLKTGKRYGIDREYFYCKDCEKDGGKTVNGIKSMDSRNTSHPHKILYTAEEIYLEHLTYIFNMDFGNKIVHRQFLDAEEVIKDIEKDWKNGNVRNPKEYSYRWGLN